MHLLIIAFFVCYISNLYKIPHLKSNLNRLKNGFSEASLRPSIPSAGFSWVGDPHPTRPLVGQF